MKTTGVTFPIQVMRVTEVIGARPRDEAILGRSLVRAGFSVTMTPVIETGKTHKDYYPDGRVFASRKDVDTFKHFEFGLRYRGLRRWIPLPDRGLRAMLDHHCAVEFWTRNELTIQDPNHPWIHWLFPSTSWLRNGRGRWTGRSYGEAPRIDVEDYPEPGVPLSDGGFWKTASPPPTPERSFL